MNKRTRSLLSFALAAAATTCFLLPAAAQSNATLFDFPGSTEQTSTELDGINDAGVMVGTETTTGAFRGFLLSPDGSLTSVTIPGASATGLIGINNRQQLVGWVRIFSNGVYHFPAFVLDQGVATLFEVPGALATRAFAINDHGVAVGVYYDLTPQGDLATHGFVRDAAGRLTAYDVPGALATILEGINNPGMMVGFFRDANTAHAFSLAPSGAISLLDPPGSGGATANGINDHGDVVGYTEGLGFLRSPDGAYQYFNIGSQDTFCSAINNRGTIVGGEDDDLTTHGLIIR